MDFISLAVISFMWMAVVSGTAGASPTSADYESILSALRNAGLTTSAAALDAVITNAGFLLPPSATILVPTNAAMEEAIVTVTSDVDLLGMLAYHVVAENFPVDVLSSLPVGTQIPTLLPNHTLLVTENFPSFHINARELVAADVCSGVPTVACYAVDVVLDRNAWGHAEIIFASPPVPAVFPPVEAPVLPPPGLPLPPVGAPVLPPPVGAPVVPPVGSPLAPPAFPPLGSPVGPPGSLGGASGPSAPGSPGGAPGPNTPGSSGGAGMASTPCHAVVVIALMVAILFM